MGKSKFTVTAVLKLVPDGSNLAGITKAINKALKQVPKKTNIDLKVRLNSANFKAVKNSLSQLTKNININQVNKLNAGLKQTSVQAKVLGYDLAAVGHQAALATKRFGGFVIGTFAIRELGLAFKETFRSALEFQESLVKVGQVTKSSLKDLKVLEGTITRVSTSLGVDSEQLIKASQTLSQAGLNLKDTEVALEALAKTTLSPSFGDLEDTTEGLISAMAQFKFQAKDAEQTLGSINAIAAATAVESEDLIDVIKRTGGAFQATGGDLNELLALFTAVRATTRESAGTIGTGFRTIFTRLQRPGTIEFLNSLGIELRDANNQFIGGFEAVQKLSSALKDIPSTDPRFAQIVEELGGIRQVSKVIPLIKEFGQAETALQLAMGGRDSIQKDVIRSQESMLRQFREIKEEFKALVREFANNTAIKGFISLMLEVTRTLIRVGDAIVPLIPLFVGLGAKRGIGGLQTFLLGGGKSSKPGFIPTLRGFNKGGPVGGIGSGDTVPAMLTPGEFVLNKDVVRKVGTGTLHAINSGVVRKFAAGGLVDKLSSPGSSVIGGVAIAGLISTFSELDSSIQKLVTNILSVGAQFLLFKKAIEFNNPIPTSSSIKGTREVKIDRILANTKSRIGASSVKNIDSAISETKAVIGAREVELQARASKASKLEPFVTSARKELNTDIEREKISRSLIKNEQKIRFERNKELGITREKIKELKFVRGFETDPKQKAAEFFTLNPNLKGIVPESIAGKPNVKTLANIDKQLREQRQRAIQLQAPIVSAEDRQFVNERSVLRRKLSKLGPEFDAERNRADFLTGRQTEAQSRLLNLTNSKNRLNRLGRARKLIRAGATINKFAPGAAAVGSVGGALLSGVGSEQIAAGNISGGRAASAAGGALSGAAQGALFGSLIAPALGPLAPFGIAIGAAGGAIVGFTTSLIGANKEIENLKFTNSLNNFRRVLDSISAGRTSVVASTGNVSSILSTIQNRINTSTGDSLISAEGEFENLSPSLQDFFGKLAQSSSTFEQFSASAGTSLRTFSELSSIPLADLTKQYKEQIKAQNDGIKTQKLLNEASFEAGLQLRASLSFIEGLARSSTQIEQFSNSIQDFSSIISGGGTGSLGIDKIPSIRSQDFSSSIGNVAGFFGPEASNIFSELGLASKALAILPDVLIDLKSNRLQGSEDLDIRLRRSLSSNLGVSSSNDVINKLVNTFREIGGEEGEPKFLQALDTDFAGTIEKFNGTFSNSEQIIKNGSENVTNILLSYGEALQKVADSEISIANMRLKSIETLIDAEKTLASTFERDINFRGLEAVSNVANGPNSPQQLGAIISAATSRATAIQDRLRGGGVGNFAEGQALVQARQAELITIDKAKLALERLAETSNTTSVQLDELGKLRSDRDTKREFASGFVFGGSGQRRETGIGIQAATVAAASNSLQDIPDTLKDSVLQILRQFSDVKLGAFGGRTGLEVEKDILQNTALASGLSPEDAVAFAGKAGSQEQRLQQAIVDGINTSMDAQKVLQEVAVNDQKTLIQITQAGFTNVVTGFRDAILEGQQAGLKGRLQQTQNTFGELRTKQAAFSELAKLGVTTPEQIKSIQSGIPQKAIDLQERITGLRALNATLRGSITDDPTTLVNAVQTNRQALMSAGLNRDEIRQITTPNFMGQVGPGSIINPKIEELVRELTEVDLNSFGGAIPNLGNTDKITKLLEVIGSATSGNDINKQLQGITSDAGQLQGQIDILQKLREGNSAFGDSISQFNTNSATLAQTLSAFPSEVGHSVNGKVEVVINGTQAFESMGTEIAAMIDAKIGAAINDFTRNNFPQLRPTGPAGQVRPR